MYEEIRNSLDEMELNKQEKEVIWERVLAQSADGCPHGEGHTGRRFGKILLVAAAAVAVLTGAAFAANLLGLQTILMPEANVEHPVTGETLSAVSYTKPADGPEEFMDWVERCDALTADWDARMAELFPEEERPFIWSADENVFVESNGDGTNTAHNLDTGETKLITDEELEERAMRQETFAEEWNRTRQEALEELALQYGLTVRNEDEVNLVSGHGEAKEQDAMNEMAASVCSGELFNGGVSYFDKFYWFEGGSLGASYMVEAPSGHGVSTYIRYTPLNEYVQGNEVGSWLFDADTFESHTYTTADGTEFTVCRNDGQAMAYAYLRDGYCVLEMHNSDGTLTEEDVRYALDFVNFGAIG